MAALARKAELAFSPPPEGVTLGILARDHLVKADGDMSKATTALQLRLEKDGDLLRVVIMAAIKTAVESWVGSAHRTQRAQILRSTVATKEGVGGRLGS